jgi:hypothetical protein
MRAWGFGLTAFGLFLDIIGAGVLLWEPLFRSEKRAEEQAGMYLGHSPPQKAALLGQSRAAKWGLGFLGFGFLLQLVGASLSYYAPQPFPRMVRYSSPRFGEVPGPASSGFENASNVAATIESGATVIGLVVGGVWVYFKFIKDRVYRPRFDIQLRAGYTKSGDGKTLLCQLSVKNIGTSKIRLVQEGTGVRLSTGELPETAFQEFKWNAQRVYPVFEQHEWFESNETIRHELAVGLPAVEQAVLLEARLVCEVPRSPNNSVYSRAVVAPDARGRR